MYLQSIQLHNFKCFESFKIDFSKELTVIVGNNGSGKTSILDGIAIAMGTIFTAMDGLSGRKISASDAHVKAFKVGSADDVQQQYPVNVEAVAEIDNKKYKWHRSLNSSEGKTTIVASKNIRMFARELQSKLREGDDSVELPMIAYYGTNRIWDYHREKKSDSFRSSTRTNGYIDCLSGTTNLKLMLNWFRKITVQKYQRLEKNLPVVSTHSAVYKAIEKCFEQMTGYEDSNVYYNMDTNELKIDYTDTNGYRMSEPFGNLSDGYKCTISLIADIAYRMAVLNPQYSDNVLTETQGLIMIDEVDLHLHPKWQQKVIGALQSIFPKIQFIVTTHAPAVINSVYSKNLRILSDREIVNAGSEVYGKDVGSVLGEIMGTSQRPIYVQEQFDLFYKFVNEKKFTEAREVLDGLDKIRNYNDSEVASCRVKLKLEEFRGGIK